jgi:hypothetical protein
VVCDAPNPPEDAGDRSPNPPEDGRSLVAEAG